MNQILSLTTFTHPTSAMYILLDLMIVSTLLQFHIINLNSDLQKLFFSIAFLHKNVSRRYKVLIIHPFGQLLADMFLYSDESEFIEKLLSTCNKQNSLAAFFNFTLGIGVLTMSFP